MKLNEIKKALYKEKPVAYLDASKSEHSDISYYTAVTGSNEQIYFEVPKHESEGFAETMQAQLLIRWIIKHKD